MEKHHDAEPGKNGSSHGIGEQTASSWVDSTYSDCGSEYARQQLSTAAPRARIFREV